MKLAAISESKSPTSSQLLVLSNCMEGDHETPTGLDGSVQNKDIPELAEDAESPANPHRWHEELTKVTLLSDREFQVFRLLGNGSSNRGIARHLRITERTAKAHMSQIMAKLGVESRLQAGLVSYTYQLTISCNIPLVEFCMRT
ncbi:response regulator transcription factor [Streptomyces sp. NPDC090029]|uniref:helix-turn-helix transcriptional regulator n=1 Tax=Streptomyces sp. NPDC090029 TaxID=3365924 RepID=UPI00382007E8